MTATAVVHLITRSAAITGHRQRRKTWSEQWRYYARLVGLAPRLPVREPDQNAVRATWHRAVRWGNTMSHWDFGRPPPGQHDAPGQATPGKYAHPGNARTPDDPWAARDDRAS